MIRDAQSRIEHRNRDSCRNTAASWWNEPVQHVERQFRTHIVSKMIVHKYSRSLPGFRRRICATPGLFVEGTKQV